MPPRPRVHDPVGTDRQTGSDRRIDDFQFVDRRQLRNTDFALLVLQEIEQLGLRLLVTGASGQFGARGPVELAIENGNIFSKPLPVRASSRLALRYRDSSSRLGLQDFVPLFFDRGMRFGEIDSARPAAALPEAARRVAASLICGKPSIRGATKKVLVIDRLPQPLHRRIDLADLPFQAGSLLFQLCDLCQPGAPPAGPARTDRSLPVFLQFLLGGIEAPLCSASSCRRCARSPHCSPAGAGPGMFRSAC